MFVEHKPRTSNKKKKMDKNEIQAIDDMVFSDESSEEEKCQESTPQSAFAEAGLSLHQQTTSCDSSGNRVEDVQTQKSQGMIIFNSGHVKARGNTIKDKPAEETLTRDSFRSKSTYLEKTQSSANNKKQKSRSQDSERDSRNPEEKCDSIEFNFDKDRRKDEEDLDLDLLSDSDSGAAKNS